MHDSFFNKEKNKYNIIYADPPWSFNNKKTGGSMKSGASSKYKCMSLRDICVLPVSSICKDDCILFMWHVASMPQEALKVVEYWGFKLKTMNGFNWVKKTKKNKNHFGMGFWTRQGSESCLIATKGKIKPICHNVRSVTEHTILKHSEKPNVFRHKIIDLMGDLPRVELFAREKFQGWDSWGNEI